MTPREAACWRQAYELFGDLVELDPALRSARLAAMEIESEVLDRVQQLLAAAEMSGPLDHLAAGDLVIPFDASEGISGSIGDWRLGEILGRGGMGVVFGATRQGVDFEQFAALKLLLKTRLDDRAVARFEQERRILARLDHPNIARLIDGGTTVDGTPYLVLEAIDGIPIDDAATAAEAKAEKIVEWLLDVCSAISHAHRNLIVHRDLKPANILVDQHGQVRVLDFGVAKLLDSDGETETTRVLTPGYGAPEQRNGGAVTTATDVFGLGAVAFRLLAGQPPSNLPLPAPSSAVGSVYGTDADLDNIVAMATRPEPRDRYPSVDALAEDLNRWSRGEPVRATPDRLAYRLKKFVARHRTTVIACAAVALSLVVGSGVAMHQAMIARQEAERSRVAETEARRQQIRAERISDFLASTFRAADPGASGPDEITAREIVDAGSRRIETGLLEAPEIETDLRSVLGRVAFTLGDLERAEALLAPNLSPPASDSDLSAIEVDRRLRDTVTAARVASKRGQSELAQERFDAAFRMAPSASIDSRLEAELRYCVTLVESRAAGAVVDRLEALVNDGLVAEGEPGRQGQVLAVLASAYDQVGRFEQAKQAGEAALDYFWATDESGGQRQWRGRWLVEQADVQAILANIEAKLGELDRALELAQSALEIRLRLLGPRHPNVLVQRNDVATLFKNLGRFDESAEMLSELLESQIEVLGDAHPYIAYTHFNLAEALARSTDGEERGQGASQRALDHYRQAVERLGAASADQQGPLPVFRALYGHALARAGQSARGESEIHGALRAFEGPEPPLIADRIQVLYAEFLNDRGRQAEAASAVAGAVERLAEGYGVGSRHHALALLQRGRSLERSDPEAAHRAIAEAVEALRSSQFHRQYGREIRVGDAALARLTRRAP